MRDYWLNKLFYDLQNPTLAGEYRSNRDAVLSRYPLAPEVKSALEGDDVGFLAARVNAYLLRYYFFTVGWKDEEFIRRIRGG